MRIIQVPVDEDLLKQVDKKSHEGFKNRSEFIRQACRYFIRFLKEKDAEEVYARGYKKIPEKVNMAKVSAKLSGSLMQKEEW